jgi:hypothetical protein
MRIKHVLLLVRRIAYICWLTFFSILWVGMFCVIFGPFPFGILGVVMIYIHVRGGMELCPMESVVLVIIHLVLTGVVVVSVYLAILELRRGLNRSVPSKSARSYAEFEENGAHVILHHGDIISHR